MTADNILPFPSRSVSNGAREALTEALDELVLRSTPNLSSCDFILTQLWVRGFKVIPLEDGDEKK